MSISGSHSRLKQSTHDLMVRWQALRASWRDVKADDFEKQYLEPLQAQVRKVQIAMENMDNVLRNAQRDCE